MAKLSDLGISIPDENVQPEFTEWIPWASRYTVDVDDYRLHTYSGVYVLAHLDGRVTRRSADPLDKRIIYIGEGSRLKKRWYAFERSIGEHRGHSGGHSYRDEFRRTEPMPSLHVAALPIWLKQSEPDGDPMDPCSLTCRLRHHVEQALLWHHSYRKSGAKLLNRK